jgi:hypothetical protein
VAPRFFRSRDAFRAWLEKHHATHPELWVGFYKKASGKGGLTYPESVDEALCFGMDRRRQEARRRGELHAPLLAAHARQLLERGEHQALQAAGQERR